MKGMLEVCGKVSLLYSSPTHTYTHTARIARMGLLEDFQSSPQREECVPVRAHTHTHTHTHTASSGMCVSSRTARKHC